MRVQAVLWDVDGTLADSEDLHYAATVAVLSALGRTVPNDLRTAFVGQSLEAVHRALDLAPALSLEAYALAKHQAFLGQLHRLHPRHSAPEAVDLAARAGCRQATVTNSGFDLAEPTLRATGLFEHFAVSVCRDEVRCGKPAPDPYLLAAARLNLPPAACLVVEDSLPGVLAGLAAGMTVIAWPQAGTVLNALPSETLLVRDDAGDGHGLLAALSDHLQHPGGNA